MQVRASPHVGKKVARRLYFMILRRGRTKRSKERCANTNIHIPTLCVAQQICELCADSEDMSIRCRLCGVRDFVFKRDPVKQLVELATRPTKYFKQVICIAHNAKSFDAQFILRFTVESASALVRREVTSETMNDKVREQFFSILACKNDSENYFFESEIKKYCRNDVVILR